MIGEGQYGFVYQIKHSVTKEYYAAKISKLMVDEDMENQEEVKYLFREINIFSILDHPSILKFIGYSPINFEGDPTPTIVTEYAVNNSLQNVINQEIIGLSPTNWNFTKKLIVIYGVASGMSYLHKHNVIHRDLKPDNILMDENLYPKIADFGMSKLSDILSVSMNFQSQKGYKGTPIYIAPEVLKSDINTKEGDVYSFAMLVFILLTAKIPFKGMNFLTLIQKVASGVRPEITCDVPDVYKELIENCWDQNPEKRPTFDQITNEIRSNNKFIIDVVDKDEFDNYVEKVDEYKTTFNTSKRLLNFNEFVNGVRKKQKYIFGNIIDSDSDSEQDSGVDEIQLENKKETKKSNDKSKNNELFVNIPKPINDPLVNIPKPKNESFVIPKPIQGFNEKSISFPKLNNDFFANFPKPNNESFVNIPKPNNESFVIPKPIQIQGNLNQQNGKNLQILAPVQIQGFNSISQKQIQPPQISSKIPSVSQKQEVSLEQPSEISHVSQNQEISSEPQTIYETLSINQKNQENSLQTQQPLEVPTKSQNQEVSLKQHSEIPAESQNQEISSEPQKIYETLSINQKNQENSLQTQQPSENSSMSKYKIIRLQMDEINEFIMKSQEEKENQIEIIPNKNEQDNNRVSSNNDNENILSKEDQYSKQQENKLNYQQINLKNSLQTQQPSENKLNYYQQINLEKMPIIHKEPIFYPLNQFYTLNEANRELVIDANDNHEKQFLVGKYLIKGENNFPQDIELGLKYLNESKKAKCTNAIIFYINMLIKGDIYPQDFSAAKKIINQNFSSKDPPYFVLLGKLSKKKKHYSNAIKYFEKGVKVGNSESIYQYAKMFFFGLGVKKNTQEAFKYFFISKNNGHQKSQSFLTAYQFMSTIDGFKSLPTETQSFFISSVAKTGINENNNNKDLRFDKLKIKSDKTEAFFINNSLQSPGFMSCLQVFKNIIIYIKYPSKLYKQILDLISKIKQYFAFLTIEIFVTDFDKIDTDVINVTISPHVHEIPDNIFIGFTNLTTITIPFTVTKIGKNAFNGCSSLQNIYIPPTVTKIKHNAFINCSLLNQVTIPSSVTVIERCLFKGCSSLEKINLPSELTMIEEHAFEGCASLKEIEIPSHVFSIGKYAFCGCISIKQIGIPFGVNTIKDYTFDNCSSLISFEIPSNVSFIGNYSFRKCSSLIQVVIPSSIKSIGCYAFSECSFLRNVIIDSTLESIGEGAFSKCSNLTSVVFEENSTLLSIEENLFYECKSLYEITMPNSLKFIEKYAFYGCSSLEKVNIYLFL